MALEPLVRLNDLFDSYVIVRSIDPFPFYWIDGRYKKNIRMDRNKHLQSGGRHYHIYGKPKGGRRGNLVGVVKEDGTSSHGTGPFILHPEDAEALRREGVPVPADNVVRWIALDTEWFALIVTVTDSSSASDVSRTP